MLPATKEKIEAVKALAVKTGMSWSKACEQVGLNLNTFYTYNISGVRGADIPAKTILMNKIYEIHKETGKSVSAVCRDLGINRHQYTRLRATVKFETAPLTVADRMSREEFEKQKFQARLEGIPYERYFKDKFGLNYGTLSASYSGVKIYCKWIKEVIEKIATDKNTNKLSYQQIDEKYNIRRQVLIRTAKHYGIHLIPSKRGRGKGKKTLLKENL
jgi:predicted DNA binding CopG/RHH family protein